jgi:hypothetical protein
MRSIRCEVCGTRALMAASTCPKCGHQFAVRDGFGELLPLAHCPTCNSDYPLHLGKCHWCGTPPEPPSKAPYVWKGVGVVAFVAIAWGAWLVHDDRPANARAVPVEVVGKPDSSTSRFEFATESIVPRQPVVAREAVASADSPDATVRTVPVTEAESTPIRSAARPPVRAAVQVPPPRATAKVAPRVASASKSAVKPSVRSPKTARWVSSVVRSWVVVRAEPSPRSRIVASIGPNTRVQLGESRGGWRRVTSKGLGGWVEERVFLARASVSRKVGRFAAR